MRFLPTISFISLLVLFLELVALPFFLHAGDSKAERISAKSETCCAKKASTGGCSKTADTGSDGPECCVNCPLFYVMMTPQFSMAETAAKTVERNYPDHSIDYSFIHYRSAWKPPNAC